MNKNWLYRVLALVLIAMLALPVALAEEVEEVEAVLGAEGAVEDLYLGNDADVGNWLTIDNLPDFEEDFEFGFDTKKWDYGAIDGTNNLLLFWDGDCMGYDEFRSISYKSSKTSVATVGQYGTDAIVFFVKPGKVTITVTGKFGNTGHRAHKFTTKITFNVIDPYAVDTVKTYYGDDGDKEDVKKSGHNYGKVDMGAANKILIPVGYDGDGNCMSYTLGEDSSAETYVGGWKWRWSNSKVAYFLGHEDHKANGYWAEGDYENDEDVLIPVFYKPGTATVTFTAPGNGKKATAKFTVKKKEKTWTVNKKSDKVSGSMIMRVKKVKFTDMEHAEVTIFCINDSGTKYPKGSYLFEIGQKTSSDEPTVIWSGVKKITKDVKDGAVATFTLKFGPEDWESFDPFALPDLDKGRFVCNSDAWTDKAEASVGPAWGNNEK